MRWALSILDWRSHAIDDSAEHPVGSYRAVCGHLLTSAVLLVNQPHGRWCEACASTQVSRAVLRLTTD